MFKIFKNHKAEEAPKPETIEELPVEQAEKLETKEELIDSESIDVRLEALTDYFEQCEKNGIEMTKEMVETEIRERLGIEVEDLLGEEITDPELKLTHQEIISKINGLMEQKAEEKGTALSFLRDKVFKSKFAKAAFVTALLFLKFNPAQAADHKENIKDKIEHETKKPVGHEGDGDKTFKAEPKDFSHEKMLDPKGEKANVIISASSSFESGKAIIKDAKIIKTEFDKFLSSIDSKNIKELLGKEWTVKGSSDETHPGINEKLTNDRIDALSSILKAAISKHDFSKKIAAGEITQEEVKQILAKEILEKYPVNGPEKGVTYLTDLKNPATNQKYTAEEIKVIKDTNPAEYKKLLKECRYTNFELTADDKKVFNIDGYDECGVLVDNSGSMQATKTFMAAELINLNLVKDFKVALFSDKISKFIKVSDTKSAAREITNMKTGGGSDYERVCSSAVEYLKMTLYSDTRNKVSAEDMPDRVLYIATDEAIQDVHLLYKVDELAKKTNTDVVFLVFYNEASVDESGKKVINHKIIKLSTEDMKEQIEKNNALKNNTTMNRFLDKDGKQVVIN